MNLGRAIAIAGVVAGLVGIAAGAALHDWSAVQWAIPATIWAAVAAIETKR